VTPRVPYQNESFTRVIYVQINTMCSANMTRFMLSGELRTTILTKDISSLLTIYLYLDDLYLRDLPHSVVEKNTMGKILSFASKSDDANSSLRSRHYKHWGPLTYRTSK